MSTLIQRLRHPIEVDSAQGWMLDDKAARSDMRAAAQEIERLQAELKKTASGMIDLAA